MPRTEESIVVNPDRFARELKGGHRRQGMRKEMPTEEDHRRRLANEICDACLIGQHRKCLGECPCIHWQLAIV